MILPHLPSLLFYLQGNRNLTIFVEGDHRMYYLFIALAFVYLREPLICSSCSSSVTPRLSASWKITLCAFCVLKAVLASSVLIQQFYLFCFDPITISYGITGKKRIGIENVFLKSTEKCIENEYKKTVN